MHCLSKKTWKKTHISLAKDITEILWLSSESHSLSGCLVTPSQVSLQKINQIDTSYYSKRKIKAPQNKQGSKQQKKTRLDSYLTGFAAVTLCWVNQWKKLLFRSSYHTWELKLKRKISMFNRFFFHFNSKQIVFSCRKFFFIFGKFARRFSFYFFVPTKQIMWFANASIREKREIRLFSLKKLSYFVQNKKKCLVVAVVYLSPHWPEKFVWN